MKHEGLTPGFTVATRDEKDFKHFGVKLINPFKL